MTGEEMIRAAAINVEAWSAGDWERMKEPLSQEFVCREFGTERTLRGIDQAVEAFKQWKEMAPDGQGRITNFYHLGDTVVLEVLWSGTQSGPLKMPDGEFPPSGKSFTVPACQVVVFQDDKIIEMRHYFDLMTLLQQIGAMPQRQQAEAKERISPGM